MTNLPSILAELLPYAQVALLGGMAWVIRELVVRQGDQQQARAREVLVERLEKVYGPLYFVEGEMLQQRLSGCEPSEECLADLRAILRTYGHHLRAEHHDFAVNLLFGKRYSGPEASWHRHSVITELEKLRFLVYGSPTDIEAAMSSEPLAVIWRWLARILDYTVATVIWALVFGWLAWLVLNSGAGLFPIILLSGVVVLLIAGGRQVVSLVVTRDRFSTSVLREVRRGHSGREVRLVQLMLQGALGDQRTPSTDGVFGSETEQAVRTFQAVEGLKVTGKLDKRTRTRLFVASRRIPAPE